MLGGNWSELVYTLSILIKNLVVSCWCKSSFVPLRGIVIFCFLIAFFGQMAFSPLVGGHVVAFAEHVAEVLR